MRARSENGRVGVDPVPWVGVASCAGGLALAAPLATFATTVLVLVLLARRGARWTVALAVVAFGVGLVRADSAVRAHESARAVVLAHGKWPSRCTIVGTVSRSPVFVSGGVRVGMQATEVRCEETGSREQRTGNGERGRENGMSVTLHVPIDVPAALLLGRGDLVEVSGSVAPPYRFWNPDAGDPRPSAARRGVVLSGGAEDVVVVRAGTGWLAAMDRVRAHVRGRILASFPADTSAMARALMLGEDDLPVEDQRAFRRSGLAHLLAVSGMHLVLVVMGFVGALRALLARIPVLVTRIDVTRIASGAAVPVAWLYAELAGASGSAVRAAWMCTVALLARALGRRSMPWRALGLSLLAMSVLDPLVAFDISFALSALATAGILALSRPIEQWAVARWPRLPAFIVKPLATTIAATVTCAPVLTMMAPELPIGGLVANVVAVPLGETAALPLCLVHALLAGWPSAERGCAVAASGALSLVRLVARFFTWGALPVPTPTPFELATCAALAAGAALGRPRFWIGLGVVALVGLEIVARLRGAPRGILRVTFLDVGQGDAALVDLPDGSAILIDGGGLVGSPIDVGERVVAPLLSERRRSALAAVILTHPHPDHHLGLTAVLARTDIATFWDTGQGEIEGAGARYAELLADARSRKIVVLRPGELCGERAVGGAIVEVLAPCPFAVVDRGANDNSFVLRIRFGERAILFTGDAEHDEEAELVERLGAAGGLHADVLKVGHHGSRTSSTPAFVRAVAPTVAVISCGVRNRFGHPHAATVEVLAQSGVRAYRTDRDGAVVVTTDGRTLDVRSMAGADATR